MLSTIRMVALGYAALSLLITLRDVDHTCFEIDDRLPKWKVLLRVATVVGKYFLFWPIVRIEAMNIGEVDVWVCTRWTSSLVELYDCLDETLLSIGGFRFRTRKKSPVAEHGSERDGI